MPATREQIDTFLAEQFPQSRARVESVGGGACVVTLAVTTADLRPGGTVSGPTMMFLADVALYVAILGELGLVALAVTTQLSINFLRKPSGSHDLRAECRLIKLGRTLAVGEVAIYSGGADEPVAHVVGTYAIPQDRAHAG